MILTRLFVPVRETDDSSVFDRASGVSPGWMSFLRADGGGSLAAGRSSDIQTSRVSYISSHIYLDCSLCDQRSLLHSQDSSCSSEGFR